MEVSSVTPRKILKAKKTLRPSDRQQWKALVKLRDHRDNERACRESDRQEKHQRSVGSIDLGSQPEKRFVPNNTNTNHLKPEFNQPAPFHQRNETSTTQKKLAEIRRAERCRDITSLKSPAGTSHNGHPEATKANHQKHKTINLLRKVIFPLTKPTDKMESNVNGTFHVSSRLMKKDFDLASVKSSTKIAKLVEQKNCVKLMNADRKQDCEPVGSGVGVKHVKFVSSDLNENKTRNKRKLKDSVIPILEKMSTEAHEDIMCNRNLIALPVHKLHDEVEKREQKAHQESSDSKRIKRMKLQPEGSTFLSEYQREIQYSSPLPKAIKTNSGKTPRKRILSEGKEKEYPKHFKTLKVHQNDCMDVSSKRQSTEPVQMVSSEEIQEMLQEKIVARHNAILGNILAELTKKIESIDCGKNHEELAKRLCTRIKQLERKVKVVLKSVHAHGKNRDENALKSAPVQQPEPSMTPQYASTAINATQPAQPMSPGKPLGSSTELVILSDTLLPRKTPEVSPYFLLKKNFRLPLRKNQHNTGMGNSKSGPDGAKDMLPPPRSLGGTTPNNYVIPDIYLKAAKRNESPGSVTSEVGSKEHEVESSQTSDLTNNEAIIDLTEDNEEYISRQSRETASECQITAAADDTQPMLIHSSAEAAANPGQMPHITALEPADHHSKRQTAGNVQLAKTALTQIRLLGKPAADIGNEVVKDGPNLVISTTDGQSLSAQVVTHCVTPSLRADTPETLELPLEAQETTPPQRPELNLIQVETSKGIVLSWNVLEVDKTCAPVHSYQLYAYHQDINLRCPSQWKFIGEIKALPLPMACTLIHFLLDSIYYFAIRAKDIYGRHGPFCETQTVLLPSGANREEHSL